MWAILKEFLSHYKSVLFKTFVILTFVFLAAQYNTLGTRSNAHSLNLQIQNGLIKSLCIAHSSHIYIDKYGTFAVVKKQKIYIPDEWANIRPREDLYLAIAGSKDVFEIDTLNAKHFMGEEKEGCRYY